MDAASAEETCSPDADATAVLPPVTADASDSELLPDPHPASMAAESPNASADDNIRFFIKLLPSYTNFFNNDYSEAVLLFLL